MLLNLQEKLENTGLKTIQTGDHMKVLNPKISIVIIILSLTVASVSAIAIVKAYYSRNGKTDIQSLSYYADEEAIKSNDYDQAVEFLKNKNIDNAIQKLRTDIANMPKHAQAYFLLGKIYEDYDVNGEGRLYSEMVNHYNKYLAIKPNGRNSRYVRLKLAQIYIRDALQNNNRSLEDTAFCLLSTLDENDPDVKMLLGSIYLNRQKFDKAIAEFKDAEHFSQEENEIKYNSLGLAYIHTKEYDKAQKALEIAIYLDPKNAFAHNNLGYVYVNLKKYDQAKARFAEAVKLEPKYKNAKRNLKWITAEISKQNKVKP
jgi:tetratricopeptide (TPR) repeat protein